MGGRKKECVGTSKSYYLVTVVTTRDYLDLLLANSASDKYYRMKRRSDDKKTRVSWSAAEDDGLLKAALEDKQNREAEGDADDEEDWDEIAKNIPGKTPVQCLKRYMVVNKRKRNDEIDAASSSAAVTTETATKTSHSQEERTMTPEKKQEVEKGALDEEEEEDDDDDEDDDDNDDGKDSKRPQYAHHPPPHPPSVQQPPYTHTSSAGGYPYHQPQPPQGHLPNAPPEGTAYMYPHPSSQQHGGH